MDQGRMLSRVIDIYGNVVERFEGNQLNVVIKPGSPIWAPQVRAWYWMWIGVAE